MKKIDVYFSGVLKIIEKHDAFFHVDRHRITVIPCTQACREKICDESFNAKQDKQVSEWLYGITTSGRSVAFRKMSRFSVPIIIPIDIGAAVFNAPVILQSVYSSDIDLSTFDEIEFRGGIIDYLHLVGKALDECYTEKNLKFTDVESYSRSFSVKVNGEIFEVEYTISLDDLSSELGKIPDLRSDIHSVNITMAGSIAICSPEPPFRTYMNL